MLTKRDGIWFSDKTLTASYPKGGNSSCFQIEDKSFWFKYRNEVVCRYLDIKDRGVRGSRPTFIDIGGGNGYVAQAVKKNGFETTLLEPGDGAINARSRDIDDIFCCMIEDLPSDMTFENGGLFDVVEHIEDPVLFLRKVNNHLAPAAQLYITVPCYKFLWSSEDDFAGHFRRYTLKSLTKELNSAGFEVRYSTYFFSFLILPIFLLRVFPEKFKTIGFNSGKKNIGAGTDLVADGVSSQIMKALIYFEKVITKVFGRLCFGASLFVVAVKK